MGPVRFTCIDDPEVKLLGSDFIVYYLENGVSLEIFSFGNFKFPIRDYSVFKPTFMIEVEKDLYTETRFITKKRRSQ